jgi:hypothetical protein
MATVRDVRQKQSADIEFLCCENETVGNIHKILKNCVGITRSIVVHLIGWHANIRDSPGTGRPHSAQAHDNVQRFNGMVLEDR